MLKKIWIFLSNTFLVVTATSFRKMLLIGTDHARKLDAEKSDPDIDFLLKRYEPVLENYKNALSRANANFGVQKSNTTVFKNYVEELYEVWMPAWEGKVFNIYPKGTPESIAIFPNQKGTVRKGTQEEMLLALKTLANVVNTFEPLKFLAEDIEAKRTLLEQAKGTQSTTKGKRGLYSDELEQQRKKLAAALYGNLGRLMDKFQDDPSQVERFFDLSLLRRSNSAGDDGVTMEVQVPAGGLLAVSIPKDTKFVATSKWLLANQSTDTSVWVYFAPNDSTLDPAKKVSVSPTESVETTSDGLGWSAESPVLLVRNIGLAPASCELTVYPVVELPTA